MQDRMSRIGVLQFVAPVFAVLAFASQAKAASVEIVTVQEGGATRTVEVVRGDAPEMRRGGRTLESASESRYQVLPGTGGTLHLYDTHKRRTGQCYRVNTFDALPTIRCRWRG
jgi:hypothetical protein